MSLCPSVICARKSIYLQTGLFDSSTELFSRYGAVDKSGDKPADSFSKVLACTKYISSFVEEFHLPIVYCYFKGTEGVWEGREVKRRSVTLYPHTDSQSLPMAL